MEDYEYVTLLEEKLRITEKEIERLNQKIAMMLEALIGAEYYTSTLPIHEMKEDVINRFTMGDTLEWLDKHDQEVRDAAIDEIAWNFKRDNENGIAKEVLAMKGTKP